MAFGWPSSYYQLSPEKIDDGNSAGAWDRAVAEASEVGTFFRINHLGSFYWTTLKQEKIEKSEFISELSYYSSN